MSGSAMTVTQVGERRTVGTMSQSPVQLRVREATTVRLIPYALKLHGLRQPTNDNLGLQTPRSQPGTDGRPGPTGPPGLSDPTPSGASPGWCGSPVGATVSRHRRVTMRMAVVTFSLRRDSLKQQ